jgi:hypothetical protein
MSKYLDEYGEEYLTMFDEACVNMMKDRLKTGHQIYGGLNDPKMRAHTVVAVPNLNSEESIAKLEEDLWDSMEAKLSDGWVKEYMVYPYEDIAVGVVADTKGNCSFKITYGGPFVALLSHKKLTYRYYSYNEAIEEPIARSIGSAYNLSERFVMGALQGYNAPLNRRYYFYQGRYYFYQDYDDGFSFGSRMRACISPMLETAH